MKCAKTRYRNEIDAKIALSNAAYSASQRSDEKRKEVRAYHCPKCKGYHLTSEPKRSKA